jgi:hypothetical protein
MIPYTIHIAISKLQHGSTHYKTEAHIKAFELVNTIKKDFSEINEDLSVLRNLTSLLISKS